MMRAVVWFLGMVLLLSCLGCHEGMEESGGAKFALNRRAVVFYYAQYTFSHSSFDSVTAAVRIQHSGSVMQSMDVKDLTNTASAIESMTLSASGTQYVGATQGQYGGSYRVSLDSGSCCGAIQFIPTADTSVTIQGTRDRLLTEAEWNSLTSTPISSPAQEYFYAKYKFTSDSYDDVDVAVRIPTDMSSMDVKDLTATSNPPPESMTLTMSNSEYVGTVAGDNGGTYRVVELNGVCCGDITFTPSSNTTVTVVGKKTENLTAEQWSMVGQAAIGALAPTGYLGTVEIGKMFSVKAEGIDRLYNVMILEAHSSSGKVEGALAHFAAVGANAYHISTTSSDGSAEFDVFLTTAALNSSVKKLVGSFSAAANTKGEVTVTPADNSESYTLANYPSGAIYFTPSSPYGRAVEAAMVVDASGTVKVSGSGSIGGTGYIHIDGFSCSSGDALFVKMNGRVYQGYCTY